MPTLNPFMVIYDTKKHKHGIDLSKIREMESDSFNGHNVKFSDGKVIYVDALTLMDIQTEWDRWRLGKRFTEIDCRDKESSKRAISYIPEIKNVAFNPPLTVVIWGDDTKTFVKCSEDENYDPEKGLAMAIAKKALGNKYDCPRVIDEWVDKKWEKSNK